MQIEILVPANLASAANTLAACKGPGGAAELLTFRSPRFTKEGVEYCWCQVTVSDEWLKGMTQPVSRPEWDQSESLDIKAAQEVLSNALILNSIPEELPDLSRMVILIGTGLPEALGLDRIPEES